MSPTWKLNVKQVNNDEFVKSLLFLHSRVGGNPEGPKMIRSKSVLISRLRGNDKKPLN